MQFPNALEGVKKIYKAEIIDLISGILALVATIIMVVGLSSGSEDGEIAGVLGAGVLLIVVAVLNIIAFIMNLIGLNKAKLDEDNFKYALYCVLVGIIASIVLGVTKEGSLLQDLSQTINTICNFLCSWYVCTAVISLAERLGDAEMSTKAGNARKLLMAVWISGIVMNIISVLLKNLGVRGALSIASGVAAVISGVLSIFAYILYIKMLSASRVMLEH